MSSLEVDIDQLKLIKDAVEFRETYYRLQAKQGACSKDGLEWIERYARSTKLLLEKVHKCMRREIRINYNPRSNRYDWAEGGDGYPEWRMGLKDLEETKSWLMNEKFLNPYIVFIVDG